MINKFNQPWYKKQSARLRKVKARLANDSRLTELYKNSVTLYLKGNAQYNCDVIRVRHTSSGNIRMDLRVPELGDKVISARGDRVRIIGGGQ